jgi:hypothetical protein
MATFCDAILIGIPLNAQGAPTRGHPAAGWIRKRPAIAFFRVRRFTHRKNFRGAARSRNPIAMGLPGRAAPVREIIFCESIGLKPCGAADGPAGECG